MSKPRKGVPPVDKELKEAPAHSVVYDKQQKKVYFLTEPHWESVELRPFVEYLNSEYSKAPRYELATVAQTRTYPGRGRYDNRRALQMESWYVDYLKEHPEHRMELAWARYHAEFYFGYPSPHNRGEDKAFGLRGSINQFAGYAGVELKEAVKFVRAKLVELVGEDVVNQHAPQLKLPEEEAK